LTYKDDRQSGSATYNYSQIQAVQQITQIFQNLSMTLEFGRRLQYFHRYQKLALDEELKRMETMANDNNLQELPAVVPILQQIFSDNSLINPVRARAQRMIERAGAGK
jgi:seryl-tRNA(Sec) selenium transferase